MGSRHRAKPLGSPAQHEGASTPNPRPVHVDEEGRIFEQDGSQFTFPGLEPEKVRASLADLAAGRGRPLREILAERGR